MTNTFAPIIEKINLAKTIVLLVHESPDGDAIGSIIGLYRALCKHNKNVDAFIESKPINCEFLLNSIGQEIKAFDKIDYSTEYDLCIALDCGDLKRLGEAEALFNNAKDTIVIDHHYTNESFANANYIDASASATGELVYELLNEMNVSLDKEIATALYSAIVSDTGNFRHNNTNRRTFKIAGELIEYEIDISKISYHMFSETSLNRMKFMGRLLQDIELFLDGKLAILAATKADIDTYSLEQSELDGMVDYARYVKGVEVGVFIKPYKDFYKISLRSNGRVDVSQIAGVFNGGGHKFASGCRIYADDVNDVKQQLVLEFSKVIN